MPGLATILLNSVACLALAFSSAHAQEPFRNNIELRGNLDNCRQKFENTGKGNVAFLGGSITEMEGYRPMVCKLLQQQYPKTDFTFTNAGIASTCSTTGAFRLEADVLSEGPVDLLFVEFAVNDDQDAHHTRRECIRGMEGIVRHALEANPTMDIVITFFVNEGMLKSLQAGTTPLTIEAHEAVAEHYNISTINLAKEVAEEITSGSLTWQKYGGVHPAHDGNAICAAMIDEWFRRNWTAPQSGNTSPASHAIPGPLDPLNYSAGCFIDPKEAKFENGWTLAVPDWRSLPGAKRSRFTSLPMLSTMEIGATATLNFSGTTVGAYIVAGPDAGIVEASVDGAPFRKVDLYHSFSAGLHYPRTVMLSEDLKPGVHSLVLRMSQDTTSGGHAMRIIQFVAN